MSEDGSRRRSTRERRRKIISDHADLAAAGGLAKSTKADPVSVALENMASALARVFSAPGASGDTGSKEPVLRVQRRAPPIQWGV